MFCLIWTLYFFYILTASLSYFLVIRIIFMSICQIIFWSCKLYLSWSFDLYSIVSWNKKFLNCIFKSSNEKIMYYLNYQEMTSLFIVVRMNLISNDQKFKWLIIVQTAALVQMHHRGVHLSHGMVIQNMFRTKIETI